MSHETTDTDSSALALHHTLGPRANQAAPGNHSHNGVSSKKLMSGVTVTGSKGGNAALASLITELSKVLGFTDNTT